VKPPDFNSIRWFLHVKQLRHKQHPFLDFLCKYHHNISIEFKQYINECINTLNERRFEMADTFNLDNYLFFKLFNNMSDLVFLTQVEDGDKFSYVLANKPAKDLWGLTEESFGKRIEEVLPEEVFRVVESVYKEAVRQKEPITYVEKLEAAPTQLKCKNNNSFVYWESTITPVFNQDGVCTHLLAVVRDISDRQLKEMELKKMYDRFELVWNTVAEAMYTFDKHENYVSVNKSFVKLLGWTEEEILSDQTISIIPEDSKEDLREIIEKLKRGETVPTHEVKRVTKRGTFVDFLASYSPIYDETGEWDGGVVVYKDITERKRYEERLKHIALHDYLTGLPNRNYFSQRLNVEMERAKQTQSLLSIFVLDIDKFKLINDTFGHDVGDDLLKEFAHRVSSSLRKNDLMARLGGDEFVILVPDLSHQTNAKEIADRILHSLRRDWELADSTRQITSSIGIAFFEDDALDEKTLFKNADLALYLAKKKGRNNYQIYKGEKTD
jgi:diguanylate cyclase (GGDEF)-like protein/PAS domain S-box-containing protein